MHLVVFFDPKVEVDLRKYRFSYEQVGRIFATLNLRLKRG